MSSKAMVIVLVASRHFGQGVLFPFIYLLANRMSPHAAGIAVSIGIGVYLLSQVPVSRSFKTKWIRIIALSVIPVTMFAAFGIIYGDIQFILPLSLIIISLSSRLSSIIVETILLQCDPDAVGRSKSWGAFSSMVGIAAGGSLIAGAPVGIALLHIIAMAVSMIISAIVADQQLSVYADLAEEKETRKYSFFFSLPILMFVAFSSLARINDTFIYFYAEKIQSDAVISIAMSIILGVSQTVIYNFSGKTLEKYNASSLILFGCVCQVIRLVLMFAFPDDATLIVGQLLHAFSFTSLYIGTQHTMRLAFPVGERPMVLGVATFGAVVLGDFVGNTVMGFAMEYNYRLFLLAMFVLTVSVSCLVGSYHFSVAKRGGSSCGKRA